MSWLLRQRPTRTTRGLLHCSIWQRSGRRQDRHRVSSMQMKRCNAAAAVALWNGALSAWFGVEAGTGGDPDRRRADRRPGCGSGRDPHGGEHRRATVDHALLGLRTGQHRVEVGAQCRQVDRSFGWVLSELCGTASVAVIAGTHEPQIPSKAAQPVPLFQLLAGGDPARGAECMSGLVAEHVIGPARKPEQASAGCSVVFRRRLRRDAFTCQRQLCRCVKILLPHQATMRRFITGPSSGFLHLTLALNGRGFTCRRCSRLMLPFDTAGR